jgi:uncharacterized protein (TIGR02996 family)
MNDHDGFMRAIVEQPDDDAPRLVYADWLEEHGDTARAEFIRVQCELARLPESDRRGAALRKREAALLKQYRKAWLAPLANSIEKGEFRRGFVERVEVWCDQLLLDDAAAVFDAAPVRDISVLTTGEEDGVSFEFLDPQEFLANRTGFERVTRLDLSRHVMSDDTVASLVRWKKLANLKALDLTGNVVDVGAMRALLKSPVLGRLEELRFGASYSGSEDGVSEEALAVLAESPRLAQLTSLGLEDDRLSEAILLRLIRSRHATRLHTLTLSNCVVTAGVLQALVETAERSARWRHLALTGDQLNSAAIRPLAESPHLTGLESLDLRFNRITKVGARALAASPALQALNRLELYGNQIPPPEKQLLKKRFGAGVARFS